MASIRKQEAGTWRVQVRRKGRSVSENFIRYEDAKRWAVDAERQIDRGETPTVSRVGKLKTFGELIDLHISDMKEVGKAPGRSKSATLKMLKHELGDLNMVEVDRERIVKFGRALAKEGAGPVTLSMDIGAIKLVIQHAAAVHEGRFDADLGGGAFKQRVARAGGGKSGGLRTLIAFRVDASCFFVYGFAKNDMANVTKKALEALQDYATLLLSYDEHARAQSVAQGELVELEVDGD